MSALIPANPVTEADIAEWYRLKQEIAKVKPLQAKEMLLRKKIFGGLWPDPVEGTNKHTMSDGYVIKGGHKIERKVDIVELKAKFESFQERGLAPDALVRYKPELELPAYRLLTAEQQAIFDECLIIKPQSPELEIVPPAKPKGKAGGPA